MNWYARILSSGPLMAVLCISSPGHADEGQIGITCPPAGCNITSPGAYYLIEDIYVPSGVAIRIAADNVDLDLNGYTVNVNRTSPGDTGILVDEVRDVRIHDGRVNGGFYGIMLEGPPSTTRGVWWLNDLEIHDTQVSIKSDSPDNVLIRVEDVMMSDAGWGFKLDGVRAGLIEDTITTNTTHRAGYLQSARALLIQRNVWAEGSVGLQAHALTDSTIQHNIASHNRGRGIEIVGRHSENGALADFSSSLRIVRNSCAQNGGTGIFLEEDVNANALMHNQCSANGGSGIAIDSSSSNAVLWNISSSNGGSGVNLYGTSTIPNLVGWGRFPTNSVAPITADPGTMTELDTLLGSPLAPNLP